MAVPFLTSEQHWVCPNCDVTAVTHQLPGPGAGMAHMHICRNGLSTPMVPAGVRCKVEHLERGDYLGQDAGYTQLDANGRPIMAAVTTRDDGEDRTVYAPLANARGLR